MTAVHRPHVSLLLAAAFALSWQARGAPAQPPPLDLVLAGGRVIDGTGGPWFRGDVGVRLGRIAALGDLAAVPALRRIDVADAAVAPGFIDMLGQSELNVLIDNRLESKIRQGITTEVTGEGSTVAPMNAALAARLGPLLGKYGLRIDWTDLDGYRARFARARSAVNLATFVGAAQVRALVLGRADVQPTGAQLQAMEREVAKAMDQGALGLSSALGYPPGAYARTEELVALARVAARRGGIYATHLRSESKKLLPALEEALRIARVAGIPIEIWHLKAAGPGNWPLERRAIARIEEARRDGVDVTADVYPYVASANGLDASLPDWAYDGGIDRMIERLRDPAQRARLLVEVRDGFRGLGPDQLLLLSAVDPALQAYMGRRLDEVARELGKSPEEALLDLVEKDRGNVQVARFGMSEENVRLALRQPWVSLSTDFAGQAIDGPFARDRPHPRAFGTMPRVLGLYARELALFPLEEAVRKMTSLPARRVGLFDRGIVRPGMAADLVVFDPATVRDTATFEDPARYPIGVRWVIVGGKVVLDDGRMTEERPGRFLSPARGR